MTGGAGSGRIFFQPKETLMMSIRGRLTTIAAGVAAALCFGTAAHAQATDTGMDDPARAGYYKALQGKRVVFVPLFMGLDLTEGWAAVIAKDAAANGYKFEVRNSNWNTAAGARTITSLISEKPDVILVQNPDVQSYAKLQQDAEKAGIHVIQVNMKSNIVTDGFVGNDMVQLGEKMGKWMGSLNLTHRAPRAVTLVWQALRRRRFDTRFRERRTWRTAVECRCARVRVDGKRPSNGGFPPPYLRAADQDAPGFPRRDDRRVGFFARSLATALTIRSATRAAQRTCSALIWDDAKSPYSARPRSRRIASASLMSSSVTIPPS